MKRIRAEFFRPAFEGNLQPFEGFLERAARLPAARRLYELSGETMLLIKGIRHPSQDLWVGQVHRIRTRGFPDRINLRTLQEEELGLLAEEGLVERVHFAYRTDLHALALQASKDLRPSTFQGYVQYVAESPFELSIILKRGAYERLLRLRTISTMNVRVANPPDAAEFAGLRAPGVAEIPNLLTHFGAASVEVTVRRQKRRLASLIFESVRDFVDGILSHPAVVDSVETLSVEGKREDDEKLEPIDFIKDRVVYSDTVDFDAHGRLDSRQCENVMINGLTDRQAELRRE